MALDSLLTRLKRDVTAVANVQLLIHKGFLRNASVTADVSDVTRPIELAARVTAVTAGQIQTLQEKPLFINSVTGVTAVTCKKINAEVDSLETKPVMAANDPAPTSTAVHALSTADTQALPTTPEIDFCTVRPPGLTPALLAASLALDALVQAHGAETDDVDRWCWPHSTAMTGAEISTFTARLSRFTDKGLMLDRGEALVDKLVVRDRDQDDRHLCLECLHLAGYGTGSWRCGNWLIAGAAPCAIDVKLSTDLLEQLQRCDGFTLHHAAQSHIGIGGAKSE